MMTATVAQAVRILSKGKYSIGPEGTISTEDAAVLEELLADEVSLKDPGFSPTELVRFKAYLMLDVFANSPGTGNIIEKKVNLVAWKVARSSVKGTTSVWFDLAERMILNHGKSIVPSGVERCDSTVKGLDSTEIEQYGEPSIGGVL